MAEHNIELLQELAAVITNIEVGLTSLTSRIGIIQTQTQNELLLRDCDRILISLDFKVGGYLDKKKEALQNTIIKGNFPPARLSVVIWRSTSEKYLQEFADEVSSLEARLAQENSQIRVYDLVAAVITQQQIDNESKKACSVCIDDFKLEESVKKCSACENFFHNNCMTKWLTNRHTCPLCRSFLRI